MTSGGWTLLVGFYGCGVCVCGGGHGRAWAYTKYGGDYKQRHIHTYIEKRQERGSLGTCYIPRQDILYFWTCPRRDTSMDSHEFNSTHSHRYEKDHSITTVTAATGMHHATRNTCQGCDPVTVPLISIDHPFFAIHLPGTIPVCCIVCALCILLSMQ